MNYARLAREGGTASTAGTAQLAGDMLNTKTSRNAMGRKKLRKMNPEAQASIFRDPQAAEHFKWLAERVRRKKEQSLSQAAR